jgi:hypothetical protein
MWSLGAALRLQPVPQFADDDSGLVSGPKTSQERSLEIGVLSAILIASTWFPSAYPSWLQGPCTADVSGKVRFHIEGEANLMGRRLGRHGPGPYPAELFSGPVT